MKNGEQKIHAFFTCLFGHIHIRVQLQADIVLVPQSLHRVKYIRKPDGTFPGNQMPVNPVRSNIFDMDMSHPFKQLLKSS